MKWLAMVLLMLSACGGSVDPGPPDQGDAGVEPAPANDYHCAPIAWCAGSRDR